MNTHGWLNRLMSGCLLQLMWIAGGAAHAIETQLIRMASSVYECTVDGHAVFSDQPCGADARQREITEPNRMNAQDIRILERHESASVRRERRDDSSDIQRLRERCNKIREQVEEIHARMRIGYSAAQGNRYEDRLRKLDERYRTQRCERYR